MKVKCTELMRYLVKLSTILVPFVLLGCAGTGPSPTPHPTPDTDMCDTMCKHIGPKAQGGLGCEEGNSVYDSDRPGPTGVPNKTCTEFCTEQQGNGVFINPRCVMQVKSCDEIEMARLKTCPSP